MAKLVIKGPCSRYTLKDIMCCVFGLKNFDVSVYFTLLKYGKLKVNEISEKLNRDRSTVQRAVQNLINAGIVHRRQVNIKEGGYVYVYEAVPFENIKSEIKTTMNKWCKSVESWINSINENDIGEEL